MTTSDVALATDAASRLASMGRVSVDAAPASESAARLLVWQRSVADLAAAADAAARVTLRARTLIDAAPATDALTRSAEIVRRTAGDDAPALDLVAATRLQSSGMGRVVPVHRRSRVRPPQRVPTPSLP